MSATLTYWWHWQDEGGTQTHLPEQRYEELRAEARKDGRKYRVQFCGQDIGAHTLHDSLTGSVR